MIAKIMKRLKQLLRFDSRYVDDKLTFEASPSSDPLERALLWWKHDLYTKMDRYIVYSVFGVSIWRTRYRKSPLTAYGGAAEDLVELMDELFLDAGFPRLDRHSSVFEGGCNVGRNLLALHKAYGCSVEGADISEHAISIARDEVFAKVPNARFSVANLLDSTFFLSYSDGQFDLVLSRGHLMHIPKSPEKERYVEQLKRIGKAFLMIEPERPDRLGVELHQDGLYALSWDDWEHDYGMKRFRPKTKIPYSVFYTLN